MAKIEIKVPAMGESISEATVGEILKPNGSCIETNDEILELETEKVNQVLYAQQSGLISWTVSTGDTVTIGQIIGNIDTQGVPSAPAELKQKSEIKEKLVEQPKAPAPAPNPTPQPIAAPSLQPTARISRDEFITEMTTPRKELEKTVFTPEPAKTQSIPQGREKRRKMTRIRQVIARRLVEAQQTAAMLTTFNEIDMTEVISLREKYKEAFAKKHGVKLGFMSFFVKASVEALKTFPDFNSYIDGEEIVHREYFDVGIAVGTDRGLVVPIIRNCDQLSFSGVESAIEAFAKKAREGALTVEDLQGGGFTITNGGVYGSLLSTPILNPPQPGILGMHKIMKRPVVVNDQIVIRQMMYIALSYDHRLIDGKAAVSFLIKIKEYLEDPIRLELDV